MTLSSFITFVGFAAALGCALQTWRLDEAQTRLGSLDTKFAQSQADLATVAYRAEVSDRVQADLQSRLIDAHHLATSRAATIRRLTDENATLRAWRTGRLPDDVIRMYKRPALSGGAGYRDWLSQSGALPSAGGGTADKR